jgi:hypothetical protein
VRSVSSSCGSGCADTEWIGAWCGADHDGERAHAEHVPHLQVLLADPAAVEERSAGASEVAHHDAVRAHDEERVLAADRRVVEDERGLARATERRATGAEVVAGEADLGMDHVDGEEHELGAIVPGAAVRSLSSSTATGTRGLARDDFEAERDGPDANDVARREPAAFGRLAVDPHGQTGRGRDDGLPSSVRTVACNGARFVDFARTVQSSAEPIVKCDVRTSWVRTSWPFFKKWRTKVLAPDRANADRPTGTPLPCEAYNMRPPIEHPPSQAPSVDPSGRRTSQTRCQGSAGSAAERHSRGDDPRDGDDLATACLGPGRGPRGRETRRARRSGVRDGLGKGPTTTRIGTADGAGFTDASLRRLALGVPSGRLLDSREP